MPNAAQKYTGKIENIKHFTQLNAPFKIIKKNNRENLKSKITEQTRS